MLQQSASQTVGPFFSIGMTYGELNNLANDDLAGERIYVRGCVMDGDGAGVNDGVIEIWQANADGVYDIGEANPERSSWGYGRAATDDDGNYWFKTIKPGPVDGMAPHIMVRVLMRGMLLHAVTRLYFADCDNSADSTLNSVPDDRRHTLIAQRDESKGTPIYRFDVNMQGDLETVFFEP